MYPENIEAYKELAKEANLIPLFEEYPAFLETPLSVFLKLRNESQAFLLESVEKGIQVGRYSFIGVEPSLIFSAKDGQVTIREKDEIREFKSQDPLEELEKIFRNIKTPSIPGLPLFSGGAVGYLGYEMIRYWEDIPQIHEDNLNFPDMLMIFAEKIVVFDHVKQSMKLLVNVPVTEDPASDYRAGAEKIKSMRQSLEENKPEFPPLLYHNASTAPDYQESCDLEKFKKMVETAKEYILAGDIFQVVLSRKISFQMATDPLAVYCELRRSNPSPYMFYLSFGDIAIVGSSPEVLVKAEENVAEVKPIAGTRPRGKDAQEDQNLAAELLADEKEKAEHLMLVDLGRNDLGKVCDYGSVQVDEFMTVENYSHVMHIVSKVTGKMHEKCSCFDLLRSSFPAGTVSGAPKIRAMEIIDELEPVRRGPYAGAVGYISYTGNMDMCIAIRTLFSNGGKGFIQAGAGIVADSDPQKEYRETEIKAQALINALEAAERGDIFGSSNR